MFYHLRQQAVSRFGVFTVVGLFAAIAGIALLLLNPRCGHLDEVEPNEASPGITPLSERISFIESLREDGVITDEEYRRQLERIMGEA